MLYIFFIDDVNFFKRGKLSEKSETIVNKLREKMVNKLMKEESKNNEININGKLKPIFKYQDKELWRVGVICKKDCFSLTEEILKILLQKGYEWKIVSGSYKIKCRKRITEENKNSEKSWEINPLIVEIKIYGEIDPNIKDEFLIDLHKKSGSIMEFLEFSSSIISSMQKEGFVIFK